MVLANELSKQRCNAALARKTKMCCVVDNLDWKLHSFFYKNIVFRTEAGYSYFLADFRLNVFLRIFLVSGISATWNFCFQNDCGIE